MSPPPADDPVVVEQFGEFWRGWRALAHRSVDERSRVFEQLGVPEDGRRAIIDVLDHLRDRIPEPGLVLDERDCKLGWQPGVLAPTFYGTQDLGPEDGLPVRVRVFYPSIDGSPQDAQLLQGCGRYPLVAFLHGQCLEVDHFRAWDLHPAQLARSGYVVAVPELTNIPPFDRSNPEITAVEQVVSWMRTSWVHAGILMPRPMTAVVGHSWGALLGAWVAESLQNQAACSAYASLSGGWLEWPPVPPRPLSTLDMATMFMWGTGSSDIFSSLEGASAGVWEEPPGAAHKVVFRDGEHWDYLREGSTKCGNWRGPCSLMRPLAADFLATFLSHYVPPERWALLSVTIPHSLVPPPLNLTPEQEFFAGGHLQGFAQIDSAEGCSVTHTWRLPPFGGGSVTLAGN